MADTTITITITEAEMTILQTAMCNDDEDLTPSDITSAYIKNTLVSGLKNIVAGYDRQNNVTVNYSTFSPS